MEMDLREQGGARHSVRAVCCNAGRGAHGMTRHPFEFF